MPSRLQVSDLLRDATNVALLAPAARRPAPGDLRTGAPGEDVGAGGARAPAAARRGRHRPLAHRPRSARARLSDRGLCAGAAGAGTVAQDRRAGAAHAAGHRVPPRHRRGLLRGEDPLRGDSTSSTTCSTSSWPTAQTTTSLMQSTPVYRARFRCRMSGPCLKRRSPHLEHQLASEVTRLANRVGFDGFGQFVERDLGLDG